MADEMHNYFSRGYTPKVKPSKACRSCSLAEVCLPGLEEKVVAASKYIQQQIEQG
jgi:CRISPR-associated exonuclease Cas4